MLPTIKRQNPNWLPTIFNDFFSDDWFPMRTTTVPAINVKEFDKEFVIELAVPGMTKEDFRVHVNDKDQLVVSVEKKQENTDDDKPLDFDDYILDTLVVGTAMELCANLYPDDNVKYIRFATEYDERMANMYERSIKEKASGLKTLFTPKKRGIL